MRIARLATASCAASIAVAAFGQCAFTWSNPSTSGPTTRAYPGMAFDTVSNRVIMYGGGTGSQYRRDILAWNGSSWTVLNNGLTSGPGARRGHVMTWDDSRDRAVVFGGGGVTTSDTWEWDGTNWTQFNTTQPTPRGFGSMVYLSSTQSCILFGGWSSGFTYFNDTWSWNGTSWTNLSPTTLPHERGFHAMAYDPIRNRIVMYGGLWNEAAGSHYLSDTWEWDGTNWSEVTPATNPGPRAYHSMVYNPIRQRVTLFGGFEFSAGAFNDVWEWDGADWTQLPQPTTAPLARQAYGAVWDQASNSMLVFGGITGATFRNDTWLAMLQSCGPVCNDIDFNNDGSLFDPQDIDAFLSVYSEGPCIPETSTCDDIDFNNDSSVFDPCDIDSFLVVFSEGPCTPCGQ